jgi:hypothetical protein
MRVIHRLRLSETMQAIGRAGIVGLALLAFSLRFVSSTLWPSWRELEAQRADAVVARDAMRDATAKTSPRDASPADELRSFYEVFPPRSDVPELLSRLYAAAAETKLVLLHGEYGLFFDSQTGLMRFRIAVPMRGSYRQIREFIGAVLRDVPAVALDEVTFERSRIAEREVDAQVRFTLYLKAST